MTKPSLARMISMLMLAFSLPLTACGPEIDVAVQEGGDDEPSAKSALRVAGAVTEVPETSTTITRPTYTKPPVGESEPTTIAPAPAPAPAPAASADVPIAPGSTATILERTYPWDVDVNHVLNCHGVLIHPNWVLTAAHCVSHTIEAGDNWKVGTVSIKRRDPTTGAVTTDETREFDRDGGSQGHVFIHPGYAEGPLGSVVNDVAVIRVNEPFEINRDVQTVGLPRVAAYIGRQGGIVTNRGRGGTLPPGYASLLRASTIPAGCPINCLCIKPPAGSLCKGDSGSGLIDMVDGRAVVEGLGSFIIKQDGACLNPDGTGNYTDVFAHRTWILDTIGMTAEQLAGPVRVRWSGPPSGGTMSLRCVVRPVGLNVVRTWYQVWPETPLQSTIAVPMDVPGGEIAIGDCDQLEVSCRLPTAALTGYSRRTSDANGVVLSAATRTYSTPVGGLYWSVKPGSSSFSQYSCTVAPAADGPFQDANLTAK